MPNPFELNHLSEQGGREVFFLFPVRGIRGAPFLLLLVMLFDAILSGLYLLALLNSSDGEKMQK